MPVVMVGTWYLWYCWECYWLTNKIYSITTHLHVVGITTYNKTTIHQVASVSCSWRITCHCERV